MKVDPWTELDRADRKLDRAAFLMRHEEYGLSTHQSYYAMYSATRARLGAEGMDDKDRHQTNTNALHDLYRDDRTPENPGKILKRHYEYKRLDDYGSAERKEDVGREEAEEVFYAAGAFVSRMHMDVIEKLGPRPEVNSQVEGEQTHSRLVSRDTSATRTPPQDDGRSV